MMDIDGYYQQNLLTSQRNQETRNYFEQRTHNDRVNGRLNAIEKNLDRIIKFLEIDND